MSATIVSQALFLLFFLCINSPFVRLLDFSSHNHSSQIPSGLRGCSKLEVFQEVKIVDISSNDSNGMIQASFFQLARYLTKLNVSNNSFTGPIPSLPCINSPFVMLLDFSSNNHSGQIQWTKRMFHTTGSNSVTLSGLLPLEMYSAAGVRELSCPLLLSIIFQVLLAMTL
ncbi:receptor-like protein 2 [Quercus suber]|uniref:Receptor-like protein 2 n=1 Tax=Quercus suber TaxID=58331 RepID=A0AAW0LZ69_QUESU